MRSWLQFTHSPMETPAAWTSSNNALVVLLPKKVGTNCPADFRPITMIHSFAKLISKLLALWLAPRLHELVASNQNAFIKTRSIHDNYKYIQRAAVLIRKKKAAEIGYFKSL